MLLSELQQPAELIELERQLDKLFMPLGIDVQFSKHFKERILGRERQVTQDEVVNSFGLLKSKYKKRLISAKKKGSYAAVLKDLGKELNVVFSIAGGDMNLVTIMRKDTDVFGTHYTDQEALVVGSRRSLARDEESEEEYTELNQPDTWFDNSKTNSPQAPPRSYTGSRNTHP